MNSCATTCPSPVRRSVPVSVSSVGVAIALPSSTRPAPSFRARIREASSDRSPFSLPPSRRHAASIVRGSTVRAPVPLLKRACIKSSIDSRRYPIEALLPPTRNGKTAMTFASSAESSLPPRNFIHASTASTSIATTPIVVPRPSCLALRSVTLKPAANSAAVAKRSLGAR